MNIVEQLNEIYFREEPWHTNRMSRDEATLYHSTMLERGAIQVATEGDLLCGYIEVWRLNFEQLGRYLCERQIYAIHEDIYSGPIAFLANVFIRPDMRNSWVYKNLKLKFMSKYSMCPYFFADRDTKRPGAPFQLHNRTKIKSSSEVNFNGS